MTAMDWLPKEPITDSLELVRTIKDIVIEHPENHDQEFWIENNEWTHVSEFTGTTLKTVDCGTTMCVAGWAATLAGYAWDGNAGVFPRGNAAYVRPVSEVAFDLLYGEVEAKDPNAADNDAWALFYEAQTQEEVLEGLDSLERQIIEERSKA